MRDPFDPIPIPNLWLRKGIRLQHDGLGLWTAEVRRAYRSHLNEAATVVVGQRAETVEEAEAQLREWLLFQEGSCAEIAAEFMRDVLHLDATHHPEAWIVYSRAARLFGFCGPVPVVGPGGGAA